jgi:hypothetical protein
MHTRVSSDSIEIDPSKVRDLRPHALDQEGRLRVMPAEFWAGTTLEERALFGHLHGAYLLPTVELVDHLAAIIGERTAIEIGAGNGVLAEALGIPATDSLQQVQPKYLARYLLNRQPIVPYGDNVQELHASRAVRRLKPQVVIGSWVTWKYDPRHPDRKGNEAGVDELDVLRHCETYVMIGNEQVHAPSRLWDREPESLLYPPFLYSRAGNGAREFIAVWKGGAA